MKYTHTRYPITSKQYKELRRRGIIQAGTKDLHVNMLWRYAKQNAITLTDGQIFFISRLFDSCGYRVID